MHYQNKEKGRNVKMLKIKPSLVKNGPYYTFCIITKLALLIMRENNTLHIKKLLFVMAI